MNKTQILHPDNSKHLLNAHSVFGLFKVYYVILVKCHATLWGKHCPILQHEKLRYKLIGHLAQCHAFSKWWSQYGNPG